MKRLLIFIVFGLLMQSCVKDKSEYYLNQDERDPDLVGVWIGPGHIGETNTQYTEYRADGKIYTYIENNSTKEVRRQRGYSCWYTKDGIIYSYRYYGEWSNDRKSKSRYTLSEDKTKVWFGEIDDYPYVRTALPE